LILPRVNYFLKPGRKTLWVVEIDGAALGVLPQESLFAICDRQGEITTQQRSSLEKAAFSFAKDRLLGYLSYKERSEKQAFGYLWRLPFALHLSKKLIEQMQGWDFLSQERFAFSFARSLKAKNIAKDLARVRLEYEGVEHTLCEEALQSVYRNESFAVEQAVQKAARKYRRLPRKQMKQKCLAWLHRRGFRFEQVGFLLGKEIAENQD